jgi:NADH-quinone oxidoreductase subunit H
MRAPLSLHAVTQARLAIVILFAAVLVSALSACMREGSPQLIQVLDVAPREAEAGDRLEIIGAGFPQGRAAHIEFRGTLRRPGERPLRDAIIAAEGVVLGPQQVELHVTDELEALFCGVADQAAHTTFEGEIDVAFDAANTGAPPIAATLFKVTIDLHPPSPRPELTAKHEAEGERALRFLGLRVSPIAPSSGGLVIDKVTAGSRADEGGIIAGDILQRFDGVRVGSAADVIPSPGAQTVTLSVRRGTDPREQLRQVSLDGFRSAAPKELLAAATVLVAAAAIVFFFFAPSATAWGWIDRRIAARLRQTLTRGASPSLSSPSIFRSLARALASYARAVWARESAPSDGSSILRFAPRAALLALVALFAVMPFRQYLLAANLDVALLFLLAMTSLVTIALLTGGWSAGPSYSFVRALGSALQVVSFALPAAIAVSCIVIMTGSFRVQEIIHAQGGWPWEWYLFRNPVTVALFFLFFSGALAERAPRTTTGAHALDEADFRSDPASVAATRAPRAPQPAASSSGRAHVFDAAEWVSTFAMCGIAAAVFLGGWQLPGVAPGQEDARLGTQLLGSATFVAKALVLLGAVAWVRWAVPRVAMDRMLAFSWTWLVPLSLVGFAMTAAWVYWSPARGIQSIISIGMCALAVLFAASFARRLHHHIVGRPARPAARERRGEAHLNPFL